VLWKFVPRIAWLDDEAYADKMLGLMGFDYYH